MIKIAAIICAFITSLSACFGCSHSKIIPTANDSELESLLKSPSLIPVQTPETLPAIIIGIRGPITEKEFTLVTDTITKELAGGAKEIRIIIDSSGGSVSAGRGIALTIENLPVPSICTADGEAESMAFYILQSCTIRQMTKRSVLMIHNPLEMVSSETLTLDDIKDLNNDLQTSAEAMLEHNIHRLKVPREYVAKKIEHTKWFFTWKEALEIGAVDEVLPVPYSTNPTLNQKELNKPSSTFSYKISH
jgi:ATP-dependent protease ClpP protease subunit